MTAEAAPDRAVLRLSGADCHHFLTGLVTHDAAPGALVYSAILSPQGKYLADFFLLDRGRDILLDVKTDLADGLLQRLTMYRLRADVQIEKTGLAVARGLGRGPGGSLPDPRHPGLGWRAYDVAGKTGHTDWDALRVAHLIPESGIELIPGESYILEMGFDRLAGVDHRKGCYVGQEVTARMKHKTELRKGLAQVEIDGSAPVGTPILASGKPTGTLFTQSGGRALAYLRFDRARGEMRAADAIINWPAAENS